MAYNSLIPVATNTPATDVTSIQENFAQIKTLIDVNHGDFASSDVGKHTFVQFPQLTTGGSIPPATSSTELAIYNATNGASPALWLRLPSQTAGTVTNDIDLSTIDTSGYEAGPLKLRFKWGSNTISGGSATKAVTFSSAFDTGIINIQFSLNTAMYSTYSVEDFILALTASSVSGFTLSRNSGYTGATVGFNWLAIGY